MRAEDAQPGDVLLDGNGKVWERTGTELWSWNSFSGMVAFYGEWKPEYGPQGELILLVRDGRAVCEYQPKHGHNVR